MLKNYIRTAIRALIRQRVYSAINLIGLAVSMAVVMLVILFIKQEMTYDHFHQNIASIYQVNHHESPDHRDPFGSSSTPLGLAPSLKAVYPDVIASSRFMNNPTVLTIGEESILQDVQYVDPDFFQMFSFPTVRGTSAGFDRDPTSLALTESMADRLFGTTDVIGKTLTLSIASLEKEMMVRALLADPPEASSLQIAVVAPFELVYEVLPREYDDYWQSIYTQSFVQLASGVPISTVEAKMQEFYDVHNFDERFGKGVVHFSFLPLSKVHLYPTFADGPLKTSNPMYSLLLGMIALFLLIVAVVNYTTLAIGRSVSRVREVGVRKVLGAHAGQVRRQFLAESVLLTLFALPVAVVLAEILLPQFNQFVHRDLQLGFDPLLLGLLALLVAIIGVVSGGYPALVMARLRPSQVLKGHAGLRSRTLLMKSLVVLQFTCAVVLLIGTLLIGRQLSYLLTTDLGFRGDQVVSIFLPDVSDESMGDFVDRFQARLQQEPLILSTSWSSNAFGLPWAEFGYFDKTDNYQQMRVNMVSDSYINTMGMEIVEGRGFAPDRPSDKSEAVVVNEAFVQKQGWDQPIGKSLPGSFGTHEIIGVVKNFNFASLHNKVEPLMLLQSTTNFREGVSDVDNFRGIPSYLQIRLSAQDIPVALDRVKASWSEITKDQAFHYVFIDDIIASQYEDERAFHRVIVASTLLTLFVAALGLFGLSSLIVEQRSKEIGVRKVLGASVPDILTLLSREFGILVLIANVIAWPLSWFAISKWLGTFAFHAGIQPLLFLAVAIGMILFTALTVTLQAWRTANRNPVTTLRYE
ncbi:ABC transporter permease [bacterium]|nr:ABC transporter permease [bacterium]